MSSPARVGVAGPRAGSRPPRARRVAARKAMLAPDPKRPRVGEEGIGGAVIAAVVDALREPRSPLLQPDLGRRLQLAGDDGPGDAGHVRPGAEAPHQLRQPARIEEHVVVGEGHQLAAARSSPGCGPTRGGAVLPGVAHHRGPGPSTGSGGLLHQLARLARGGDVVHHDHLEAGYSRAPRERKAAML